MRECTVYVDTDNQGPALAPTLLRRVQELGLRAGTVHLFGNERAPQLAAWRAALEAAGFPSSDLHLTRVPCRRQAADVAQLLALGGGLAAHVDGRAAAVIVSRDNLLLAAAERLQDLGASVLVCHGPGAPSHCRAPTHVLGSVPATAQHETLSLVTLRRRAVPSEPCGGYRKSLVGSFLRRQGFDRGRRAAFLASLPGLQSRRAGSDRLLFI
jgi:hypothetical protein